MILARNLRSGSYGIERLAVVPVLHPKPQRLDAPSFKNRIKTNVVESTLDTLHEIHRPYPSLADISTEDEYEEQN